MARKLAPAASCRQAGRRADASATDIAAQLGFGIGFRRRRLSVAESGGISGSVAAAVEIRYARELQLLQGAGPVRPQPGHLRAVAAEPGGTPERGRG